ncbi:uracil-DNA glycosylase family protein [Bdellovibrio sp. 22V]|uniref:uracil-DNA glycosylase n=1 Tax=Bdellovibrio TaxID=958 RepID=UPI002543B760|nr:uracil-DNA glycosylase family protein [Bdellovibrio sp. 22V]WII71158.1 uracil-DNA glycosylase family protein [Bdellovibrio sp. 22V]
MSKVRKLASIQKQIRECRSCPQMCGSPVHGAPVDSAVFLIGQAPGPHEARFAKPWAYTAGKTLFKWLAQGGVTEEDVRERVYIGAVARCFPGKSPSGHGDREPSAAEIAQCRRHLQKEIGILKPKLVIAVGRLAISEVLGPEVFSKKSTLNDVVGKPLKARFHGEDVEVIALPHPSGASSWPHTEPGKTKLAQALRKLFKHPEWQNCFIRDSDS